MTHDQSSHSCQATIVPENASVSLIGKQGEVIKVDGPSAATVTTESEDEEGERALASISDLLFDNDKFVRTVGGTRSVVEATNLNEVLSSDRAEKAWFPSLSDASNYCLVSGKAILHRQQADGDLVLLGDGGETIHWQSSDHEIDLGKYFNSSDNKSMLQLSVNGRTIRLYLLEDDSGSIAEQAAWLAKQGCTHQALQLLASKIEQ